MAIRRDQIDQNRVPDTPPDWERYARLLREHGQAQPGAGFETRLEFEWDDRLAEHKRTKARQRTLAPLLTLAVAGAGFIIVSSSIGPNVAMAPLPVDNVSAPSIANDEADNFADPEIPPVWVDTSLPMMESPALPGMADPTTLHTWSDSSSPVEPPVTGE